MRIEEWIEEVLDVLGIIAAVMLVGLVAACWGAS
jgi:hypothetical protein